MTVTAFTAQVSEVCATLETQGGGLKGGGFLSLALVSF